MNPITTDTLIIGGGIHGTALALRLKVLSMPFVVVDPVGFAANWKRLTEVLVHEHLRTPNTVHIEPGRNGKESLCEYHGFFKKMFCKADKPAELFLFNRHLDDMIDSYEIYPHLRKGQVVDLKHERSAKFPYVAAIEDGSGKRFEISARKVVVAVGLGSPRAFPNTGTMSAYTADATEQIKKLLADAEGKKIAVIGGGLTGATLAASFAEQGAQAELFHRRDIHISQLEVAPTWRSGGACYREFCSHADDILRRMDMLKEARKVSTITPAAHDRLIRSGAHIHTNLTVERLSGTWNHVHLHTPEYMTDAFDAVILATGYEVKYSNLKFLRNLGRGIKKNVFDERPWLTWGLEHPYFPELYFMGIYAELQLGPLGRNIPGAMEGSFRVACSLNRS